MLGRDREEGFLEEEVLEASRRDGEMLSWEQHYLLAVRNKLRQSCYAVYNKGQ